VVSRPPLLFYSEFPLRYHNVEAERKALALQQAGYDVLYVTGPLVRNPRPSDLGRLLRRLRPGPKLDVGSEAADALRGRSLLLLPPRHVPGVRTLNAALVARQLRPHCRGERPVAWVRWPTPEVVDALPRLDPVAVVYECVDAYWETSGVTGGNRELYARSERRLLALADAVVAPSEPLVDRFRAWHDNVHLIPHGVDLPGSGDHRPPRNGRPVTLGFVGTLDYRLMVPVLRRLAEARPAWRLRLIGPVQEGFDPRAFADLDNVRVEPPVPVANVADVLSTFDVGLMPYEHASYPWSCAVKNLELFSVGTPAVATPSRSLLRFEDLLYFARTPDEFVEQVERALVEDSPELAERRREAAAANRWDDRLREVVDLVDSLVGGADRRMEPPRTSLV
jgi:glycosyltransferase involved in cell wall biosynthesis